MGVCLECLILDICSFLRCTFCTYIQTTYMYSAVPVTRTDGQMDRQTDRLTDRHRRTDRQTDGQMDGRTDRKDTYLQAVGCGHLGSNPGPKPLNYQTLSGCGFIPANMTSMHCTL